MRQKALFFRTEMKGATAIAVKRFFVENLECGNIASRHHTFDFNGGARRHSLRRYWTDCCLSPGISRSLERRERQGAYASFQWERTIMTRSNSKSKYAIALSLVMAAGSLLPALADDGSDPVKDAGVFVARISGAGAGVVVGTPIAVVRETAKTYTTMTSSVAEDLGDKNSVTACLLASVVTGPSALVIGGAKGLIAGGRNGVVHGFNEPFTCDSFSLGCLDE
jgi:hypothetical protein